MLPHKRNSPILKLGIRLLSSRRRWSLGRLGLIGGLVLAAIAASSIAPALAQSVPTTNSWEKSRRNQIQKSLAAGSGLVSVQSTQPCCSIDPSVSVDGRFVAFESSGAFVDGDTNGWADIYLRDRLTEQTTLVSSSLTPGGGNGDSHTAAISDNGRYIAFQSFASNLVPADTNEWGDVFVKDRVTGLVERVSVATGGLQGNLGSFDPSISADGRYVTFTSDAANLGLNDTNSGRDVFLHDRLSKTTSLVSVSSGVFPLTATQGNQNSYESDISSDGTHVAFTSNATNLTSGADTNNASDIFLRNISAGTTSRVSQRWGNLANGSSNDASVSSTGRYIAYESTASNLDDFGTNGWVNIFVTDMQLATTDRASKGNSSWHASDNSLDPSISNNGQLVVWGSNSTQLYHLDFNGMPDVFMRDLAAQETSLVSFTSSGAQGNHWSFTPAISGDGNHVAFMAHAWNMVPDDINGGSDIFVRSHVSVETRRASLPTEIVDLIPAEGAPPYMAISFDRPVFASLAEATVMIYAEVYNPSTDEFHPVPFSAGSPSTNSSRSKGRYRFTLGAADLDQFGVDLDAEFLNATAVVVAGQYRLMEPLVLPLTANYTHHMTGWEDTGGMGGQPTLEDLLALDPAELVEPNDPVWTASSSGDQQEGSAFRWVKAMRQHVAQGMTGTYHYLQGVSETSSQVAMLQCEPDCGNNWFVKGWHGETQERSQSLEAAKQGPFHRVWEMEYQYRLYRRCTGVWAGEGNGYCTQWTYFWKMHHWTLGHRSEIHADQPPRHAENTIRLESGVTIRKQSMDQEEFGFGVGLVNLELNSQSGFRAATAVSWTGTGSCSNRYLFGKYHKPASAPVVFASSNC